MKKIDDIKKFASNDDLKWFSCAKTSKIKATKAKGGEEIKTVLADGTEETDVRVANPGDWIVTNPDGEKYIIPDAKFQSRYEAADEEGSYKPRFKKMFATKLTDDVEFAPPKWGGDVQRIKAGGYLMRDPSDAEDIYGIAKDEFEKTYSRLQEKKEQKYTKKQITEAIKHWKKVLEQMDEDRIEMIDLGDIDRLKKICNFSFDDYDKANEIANGHYRTKPGANLGSFREEDVIPLKNCEFLLQQFYLHRPKNGKLKDWFEEKEFDALPGEFEDPGINWIWYRGYKDKKTAAQRFMLITGTKDFEHASGEVCQLHEGDWGFRVHK